MFTRRKLLASTAASVAVLTPSFGFAEANAQAFRIGWQKNGILSLVKRRGTLEKILGAQGVAVAWSEFPSGPPLLEALSAGALDFGATGDVPPIFAEAARADLVYAAAAPAPGSQSAILVHRDGPIKTIADLKGKSIAFVRGSSAHNVTVTALATAGLTLKDVTPVSLSPADAAAAFASGKIDAWSIWEPFFAIAEKNPDARVLTTAEGILDTYSFFLANGTYAKANGATLRTVVATLSSEADWSQSHLDETIKAIAEITGVAEDITRVSITRHNARLAVFPVNDDVIRVQQKTADTFFNAGLIPRHIDIRSVVWTPAAS